MSDRHLRYWDKAHEYVKVWKSNFLLSSFTTQTTASEASLRCLCIVSIILGNRGEGKGHVAGKEEEPIEGISYVHCEITFQMPEKFLKMWLEV